MPDRPRVKEKIRDRSRSLRQSMTDGEWRLWRQLRDRRLGGFKFRRQYPIGSFIADFACPEARLIVEVDGSQHAKQREQDASRTEWLSQQGFRVIRFSAIASVAETEMVLRTILGALTAPSPALEDERDLSP